LNGKPISSIGTSTGLRLQLPTGVRSGGFQLEDLGCPTEPANLAHFQKCPFKLRYTQQSLTENSMLCYGPLVSKLGAQTAQSAWCPQPRHWGGGAVPPAPRLRRLCNPVGTAPPHLARPWMKFHVATKHDQPLLGFHASRALELLSVVEENIMRGPNGTC